MNLGRSLIAVLCLFSYAWAAEIVPPETVKQRRFTLDHLWSLTGLSDVQIAPDGRTVAVVLKKANPASNRYDQFLMLINVTDGSSRTVFQGSEVAEPRWAPTDSRLAFLAQDEKLRNTQVFLLQTDGEVHRVTDFARGVERLAWSPAGDTIAVIAADVPVAGDGLERFNDSFEVGHDSYLTTHPPDPLHLWIVPLSDGAPRRLTSSPGSLGTSVSGPSPISWSPDGKQIVVLKTLSAHSGDADQSHIEVVDVATDARRSLTGRTAFETSPAVSPDGRRVQFLYPRDGEPTGASDVLVVPLAGGPGQRVASSLDRSFHWNVWLPDGSLLLGANDETKKALWVIAADGDARLLDLGPIADIEDLDVGADGTIALIASEPARPSEVYIIPPKAQEPPRRLTDFNVQTGQLELGRTETIEWISEDHVRADGVVTYPPDFDPARKWPLVLIIHGGPTDFVSTAFDPLAQLMATQGWIVFQPNYRGSDNLGNDFQRGIVPGAGSGPGRDVFAGLEVLKKRDYVDASRIAVSGWSYGGFMTVWMIGHYPGWRAAVAGAAAMDLTDMYALSDLNVMRRHAITGSPWTQGREAHYHEESPLSQAAKIRTPTLLLSNTGDSRVAISQSYKLFRAIEDNGVETRFVAYPTSGHLPVGPIRERDVYRRWIDWIQDHFTLQPRAEHARE